MNETLYDVIIIGGGPAGLTAALYLGRSRYRVLVIEKEKLGGQITITSEVVNYPGVGRASGEELAGTMRKQAEEFGAEFMNAEVTGFEFGKDIKTVRTDRGDVHCFGVLVATGAHPRKIGFDGEDEFSGHGVAYCATCDGEFFTGKEVFVIGGGFAAAEESVFLTRYAKHVTLLVREDDFTCAKSVADEARNHEKISVLYNTEVESVSGDTVLKTIRYRNNVTGEFTEYNADSGDNFGVFVFAGYEPETMLLEGVAELDKQGYVITDAEHRTSVDGLYAAGDICEKNLRQVVTAVSDGAVATTALEKYVSSMQKKTGIVPKKNDAVKSENKNDKNTAHMEDEFFTREICKQLDSVFSKMEKNIILKLYLDDKPASDELKAYTNAIAKRSDKLSVVIADDDKTKKYLPCVQICREDGSETGLSFHGVPGGHEFTSFILGIYNIAGPGQMIEDKERTDISLINKPINIQILVTLSCSMCPELVIAAQKISAENPLVTAEIFDVGYFNELREKYQVMSVPCLIVDDKVISFGKKNLSQLLQLINK